MGEQPCVFLPDRHFQYSKVLFYGRELDLLLMNVLAYSLFDLWFGSTATSVLLTFLLDFAFGFLRRRLGMANIANKTLIGLSPPSPSPSLSLSPTLFLTPLFSSPPLPSLLFSSPLCRPTIPHIELGLAGPCHAPVIALCTLFDLT